ncbi:TRAP transporter small permease [Sporosarcina sp. FSL W7-1349]|uniref:TRAP transporter small permease n=1 Tax=Sporosarcina sp. FSL W7-1349 TaxID=2921561 RepID=UPI0030F58CB3
MEIIRSFDKLHRKTEKLSVYLAGFLIMIMMALITMEVILRKLANYSIPGVFEISSQLMVGVCLLGISYVQNEKEHIAIDFVAKKFPPFIQKITNILIFLLGFFITLVFAWQGINSFVDSFKIGEHTIGILPVPIWPGRFLVAFSMVLIAFRFLLDIVNQFRKAKD